MTEFKIFMFGLLFGMLLVGVPLLILKQIEDD